MRKFATAIMAFLFIHFILSTSAQTIPISGKVLSAENNPVASASVLVKGKRTGTKTDANGNFTINANLGDVLVISGVGFAEREVRINSGSINITLQNATGVLEEVSITTAMDIKRNPRELGYSVQKVSGKEIAETQRENFINGLQGRVAGLTVNPTNGQAGSSSQIVLRGFNSMALDNQPLFVVDGIIVDNQTINETSNQGTSLGQARDLPNQKNDYTNRISDLNPNDIESVTVLKGPEATALYGSQASSGAIVITTKKGTNTGKLGLNYDNSFRFQKLTRFPEVTNKFSPGASNGNASNSFISFGPQYPEGTQIFDNVKNFFKTGFAQTHNLSADFGKKNYSFRASGSIFDQSGVVPSNNFKKYNLRITNTTKIGKFLDITPSLSYTHSTNDKPLRGASGYLFNLIVWPVTNDVRNFEDVNENKITLFNANPNLEIDNPFYNVKVNRSYDVTNRYIASLGVNIRPTKWLSIAGRFGYDTYKSDGYTFLHPLSFYVTKGNGGLLDNYYRKYEGYNHTITATATKKLGDFNVRVIGGTMWQNYRTDMYAISGTNIIDSVGINGKMYKGGTTGNGTIINEADLQNILGGTFDSSITRFITRLRLNNAVRKQTANYSISRQVAYFGEATLSYKNLAFLTYSHRWETSSIFPKAYRDYDYPAGSLSLIMSDIFPSIKKGNVLSYLKLRGSLASTARSSAPYANQSLFGSVTSSGGGFAYGLDNNNPFLQPELQKTYEIGTEMKFFKNKIDLELTYYNTLNTNQIVEKFRSSYATGFVLNTLNVGSTRNKGIEIAIDATLVNKTNFNWNVRFNFNKMYNKVLSLPDNVPEFYIGDTNQGGNVRGGLTVGGPTTAISSHGYERNNKGDILISPNNGLPIADGIFKVRGDRNPDFTLGTLNSLRYKSLSLSFLWDLKIGGDIYDGTDIFLALQGKAKFTEDRLTPRIVKGVLKDGLENTATPTPNKIVITPNYLSGYYTSMTEEEFIQHNVNWLRLRDITLSYALPQNTIKKLRYFKSISVFATGNDLVLFTNYWGADPSTNGNTAGSRGVGGWGFDYGNIATPISVNIGIKAGF
ncbi:MAG: SusC/RagA family TonB-linked outer membrane protein [Ginsengibacter sp.]